MPPRTISKKQANLQTHPTPYATQIPAHRTPTPLPLPPYQCELLFFFTFPPSSADFLLPGLCPDDP
jgi:hypothetical protein